MHDWGVDPALLLSDTRVLDVLLHNSDRHHGGWRVWAWLIGGGGGGGQDGWVS